METVNKIKKVCNEYMLLNKANKKQLKSFYKYYFYVFKFDTNQSIFDSFMVNHDKLIASIARSLAYHTTFINLYIIYRSTDKDLIIENIGEKLKLGTSIAKQIGEKDERAIELEHKFIYKTYKETKAYINYDYLRYEKSNEVLHYDDYTKGVLYRYFVDLLDKAIAFFAELEDEKLAKKYVRKLTIFKSEVLTKFEIDFDYHPLTK